MWQLLSLCNLGPWSFCGTPPCSEGGWGSQRRSERIPEERHRFFDFWSLFFWVQVSFADGCEVFFFFFEKPKQTSNHPKKTGKSFSKKALGSLESISTHHKHMGGYERTQLKSLFPSSSTSTCKWTNQPFQAFEFHSHNLKVYEVFFTDGISLLRSVFYSPKPAYYILSMSIGKLLKFAVPTNNIYFWLEHFKHIW